MVDVSHFSMVGFDIDIASQAGAETSFQEPLQRCEQIDLNDNHKLCVLRDRSGSDLWFGLIEGDQSLELVTANPAYRGKSHFPVILDGFVSDPQWEPFEYSMSVTFSDLEIPVLIDLSDPREKSKLELGSPVMLDLTAFTFDPQIFPDTDAYLKFQTEKNPELVFADDHFIPSGLFGDKPTANAMFGGKILEAELKHGPSNSRYWWALVETQSGATINVVFDDASTKIEPKPGELLVGEFWLSARVAPD